MGEILYIIMPAYNEANTIEKVVREWYSIVERYAADGKSRLVLIDDGSKDCTFDLVKGIKEKEAWTMLECIKRKNCGHGATVLYGYHYAVNHGADYIFQTDSDGQTEPEEFHFFWKQKANYDMLIGHRRHREDGFFRQVVTRVLKGVLYICFGVRLKDANTPFRLMNVWSLKECLMFVPARFYLSNVLLSVIYEKKKFRVKYIPITFRARQGGVNSINFMGIVRTGKRAVFDFMKWRRKNWNEM